MFLPLKRWLFLLFFQERKFGREITSSSPLEISGAIKARLVHMGGHRSWRALTRRTLTDWIQGDLDHHDATTCLKEIESDGPNIGEQCFAAAHIIAALGLFEASLAYEERGLQLLNRERLSGRDPSQILRKITRAIHGALPGDAVKAVLQFRGSGVSLEKLPHSVLDLLHYTNLWTKNSDSEIQNLIIGKNLSWSSYIGGKKVVVYGPGNIDRAMPPITESEAVVRIAGPGSYSWQSIEDLARGRANAVYLIPETLEALGPTIEERIRKVGRYHFLCVKRGDAPYLQNSRRVEAGSRLFLRGHPNMVPLAVIDLLRAPGTKVRVIGSDFFATDSSYRADSIRSRPDGLPQTTQGSSGNAYDRTTVMASHNPFQNRRVVKNLVDSGQVTGDRAFLEACSLSDIDYAKRLDLHYGKQRV